MAGLSHGNGGMLDSLKIDLEQAVLKLYACVWKCLRMVHFFVFFVENTPEVELAICWFLWARQIFGFIFPSLA